MLRPTPCRTPIGHLLHPGTRMRTAGPAMSRSRIWGRGDRLLTATAARRRLLWSAPRTDVRGARPVRDARQRPIACAGRAGPRPSRNGIYRQPRTPVLVSPAGARRNLWGEPEVLVCAPPIWWATFHTFDHSLRETWYSTGARTPRGDLGQRAGVEDLPFPVFMGIGAPDRRPARNLLFDLRPELAGNRPLRPPARPHGTRPKPIPGAPHDLDADQA